MSNPEITVVRNTLLVNGAQLERDNTDPEYLEHILRVGREAVLRGIIDFYEQTKARNPGATVVHPSINIMNLGADTDKSPVLTADGRDNNTGLYTERSHIGVAALPYWDAISRADFIPEARLWAGSRKRKVPDTIGLLLRDEPLVR